MKKRYDTIVIGGGVAGYAMAYLASREGQVLFFESEDAPAEPPWERPLMPMGEGSVWRRFAALSGLTFPPTTEFRFQILQGRERPDGSAPPESQGEISGELMARFFTWEPWYKRWWNRMTVKRPVPPAGEQAPWDRLAAGFPPADEGVLAYLGAMRGDLGTPAGGVKALMRTLREGAAQNATEFVSVSKFDGLTEHGIRVHGYASAVNARHVVACLDFSQWTEAPGLGPLPRKVFGLVKPKGMRVTARWSVPESELPVGMAARGAWSDEPSAFFEIVEAQGRAELSVWTFTESGPDADTTALTKQLHGLVRRYIPFFSPSAEDAIVEARPAWRPVTSGCLPPFLSNRLAYAGPQSFPGWGIEGEIAAVLRAHAILFAKEEGEGAKVMLQGASRPSLR